MKASLLFAVFVATANFIPAAETNKSERVEKQLSGIEGVLRDYTEGPLKLEDLYEDDRAPLRKRIISYFDTVTNRMPLNQTYVVACCMGKEGDFKNAENLSQRGINLPSWPELTLEEVQFIVRTIKAVI